MLAREESLHKYWLRVAEVAALFLFVALVILVVGLLLKYILPFILGWIVAVLLLPVVRFLEEIRIPRLLAVLLTLGICVALLVVFFVAAIVGVAREAPTLTVGSEYLLRSGELWIHQQVLRGEILYGNLPPQVANQLQNTFVHVLASAEKWLQKFATEVLMSVTHLPETIFVAIIAVITAFFLLLHRESMTKRFFRILPPGWSAKMEGVIRDIHKAFVGTIRVQLLLMILSAVLGIGGLLLLHFRFAVLLGILFGLFGIVPIVGSALLTVPWALLAFTTGHLSIAIKILTLQVGVSILRHLIEPKFLANNVGLDILSTLFALYVGLQAMGFIGLFIGPILLIAVKSLFASHLFVDLLPNSVNSMLDSEEQVK